MFAGGNDSAPKASNGSEPGESSTSQDGTVAELPPSASTIIPTSSVPADAAADAQDIVETAAPNLVLTGPQLACLANRLAGNGELLDQIQSDPTRGSDGFGVLVEEGERCVALIDLAPAFVRGIEPSLTEPLDDPDRLCLALAYVDLDQDQRQQLLSAGLDPSGDGAAAGRDELDALLGRCGAEIRR